MQQFFFVLEVEEYLKSKILEFKFCLILHNTPRATAGY
jgi:hypothetical protein